MSIPATVKIAGHVYSITLLEDVEPASVSSSPYGMSSLEETVGMCRAARNEIFISSSLPGSQRDSTLLHEVLEAINCNYDLGLDHGQISTLETALHAFLVENDWRPGE